MPPSARRKPVRRPLSPGARLLRSKGRAKTLVRVWRARRQLLHELRSSSSIPLFRQRATPSAFRFEHKNSWFYGDLPGHGRVVNSLIGLHADEPHLVLMDSRKPRFVLGYRPGPSDLTITSIQRVRTQYRHVKKAGLDKLEWLPAREVERQKEFANALGMHPSEFLLSEFIFSNREKILSGTRVFLRVLVTKYDRSRDAIYRPLIDRFFNSKKMTKVDDDFSGTFVSAETYELNLNKRRVREALGLPPFKK